MHKLLAVSIVFVLVLSSGAFAAILQGQSFGINTGNNLLLNGAGNSAAYSVNILPVVNTQEASGPGRTRALQTQVGSLVQSASAAGEAGQYIVGQNGDAFGGQLQYVPGYYNLGTQVQDLDADLTQNVLKAGGIGAALGIQSFIGCQMQFVVTPFGMSANVQYAGVANANAVAGGPDSSMLVSGGLDIGADQAGTR